MTVGEKFVKHEHGGNEVKAGPRRQLGQVAWFASKKLNVIQAAFCGTLIRHADGLSTWIKASNLRGRESLCNKTGKETAVTAKI